MIYINIDVHEQCNLILRNPYILKHKSLGQSNFDIWHVIHNFFFLKKRKTKILIAKTVS